MNTKPKHTPGPWQVNQKRRDRPIITVDTCAAVSASLVEICEMQNTPQDETNARLIAAAPELLQIAEAYRNLLRTMAHTEGEVATFQHIESVLIKARGE